VTLLNGIPITGIVPAYEQDYLRMYQFFVPPDATHLETLRISVTPRYGEAEVYVSTDGQIATRSHFTANNVDNGFYATSFDVQTCFDCIVSIGVGSSSSDALAYSISAVTSYSDVELQEGVPIQDHVSFQRYLYYSYEINSNADGLVVVVSPSSGDPDLVCSTNLNNTQPSMSDSGDDIFKARDFGLDQIHLDAQDIYGVSTLYCAVYVCVCLFVREHDFIFLSHSFLSSCYITITHPPTSIPIHTSNPSLGTDTQSHRSL